MISIKSLLLLVLCLPLIAQETFPGLTYHSPPKDLAANATTQDWPRFFGSGDQCITSEGPLLKTFPKTGIPLVFELERGSSYASPILAEGKLLHFHAVDSRETLDCLHPETGKRFWTFSYPIKYKDRYGFSAGPRSSPLIHKGKIYLIGVTAMLHCLELDSGKILWKRNLKEEFSIPKYFFGYGPNPIIHNNKLIINIGGKEKKDSGTCVAGLDLETGKTLWQHQDEWGASYASPIIAELHGTKVALVLAAGESRPTIGGLLALNPNTGKLYSRFPWRASNYESVLASTPLALPNNRIFISECYQKGGVLLQFDEKLLPTPIWKERQFGMHMVLPQYIDKHLYGFAGRNIPDTQLKCINLENGKILWENDMRWKENGRIVGLFRGSFLRTPQRVFSLSEEGTFSELSLSPKGPQILQKTRLFLARETWTPPVVHRGLLYIAQNSKGFDGTQKRLLCFDLRGQSE